MQKYIIEPQRDKPGIIFDPENEKFEIYGKSLPEDTNDFYDPIIEQLLSYAQNPNEHTKFVFNFEYYNSASVRKIVNILTVLEKIKDTGNTVEVIWMYEETDEIMKENGEDFKETVEIPFTLKSFKFDF